MQLLNEERGMRNEEPNISLVHAIFAGMHSLSLYGKYDIEHRVCVPTLCMGTSKPTKALQSNAYRNSSFFIPHSSFENLLGSFS